MLVEENFTDIFGGHRQQMCAVGFTTGQPQALYHKCMNSVTGYATIMP